MSKILLYKTPSEEIKLEVLIQNETIWLTQKQIAELFYVNVPAISKHIKNIYESGELKEVSTISKMETVQKEGITKFNSFLSVNDMQILQDKGKVTAKLAKELALGEFEKYKVTRDADETSDFDKYIARLEIK